MTTALILQARMLSTRLPKKVLLPVLGRPVLELLIERVRRSRDCGEVLLATSTLPADDVLSEFCSQRGIPCFRGNESDVLDRYYQAAKTFGISTIVRVTADCPLIDPQVMDQVFALWHANKADFASNIEPPTFPDGLDVYVFSFAALEKAWREAKDPFEREHVTPFFWRNKQIFKTANLKNEVDLSRTERWTLDYPEDYEFIRRVYEELYPVNPNFTTSDILELERRRPEIKTIVEKLLSKNSAK